MTAQQGVRIGIPVTGRYIERHDLERHALYLPLDEGRRRLAVGADAANALLSQRHIDITMSSA
jgi:hypothetical protein